MGANPILGLLKMKILFLGKPGSGKGTYGDMISKEFKIPKFNSGDILRDEVKKGTELSKSISSYINKGNLVPGDMILKLIKNSIEDKKDFILDGFPRRLVQEKLLKINFDIIFYLRCSDSVIMRRLINRRICPKCNKGYNLITIPPKKEGVCDVCGSRLVKRIDETKIAIKKRLEIYKKETMPLINYYKKKDNLIEIDGNREIKIVYNEIKTYLSKIINK